MKIKKLRLQNFRRFQQVELDFTPGVFLVNGLNEDDNFDSNGSGKSSLFYGLSWVLFGKFLSPDGKIVKGSSVVNRAIGYDCSGSVELELGDSVLVERFQNHKKFKNAFKCTPKVDGVIDCTFETFCSLVMFHGGGDLFYGTRQRRRDFMCSLFSIDTFVNVLKEKAKSSRNFFRKELNSLSGYFDVCTAQVESLKQSISQQARLVEVLTNQLEEKVSRLREVAERLKALKQKKAELESRKRLIPELEARIRELLKKLESLKSPGFEELNKELGAAQFEINRLTSLNKQLTELVSEPECPTCFAPIDPERLTRIVETNKQKIEELEVNIVSKLVSEIKQRELQKKQIEQERQRLTEEVNDLRQQKFSLENKYRLELESLEAEFKEKANRLYSLKSEVDSLRGEIQRANDESLDKAKRDLCKYRNTLKNLNSTIGCVTELVNGYEWWVQNIGTEFVDYALGSFFGEIQAFASKFLSQVWGEGIRLNISQDGIEFELKGKQFKLQDLSTGEQKRVFLSVALASNLVARKFSGWTCNVIIFDEVFDGLDTRGRSDLIGMVRSLADIGYSVFIVTHHIDMDVNQFDNVFTVVRSKGISRLERRV